MPALVSWLVSWLMRKGSGSRLFLCRMLKVWVSCLHLHSIADRKFFRLSLSLFMETTTTILKYVPRIIFMSLIQLLSIDRIFGQLERASVAVRVAIVERWSLWRSYLKQEWMYRQFTQTKRMSVVERWPLVDRGSTVFLGTYHRRVLRKVFSTSGCVPVRLWQIPNFNLMSSIYIVERTAKVSSIGALGLIEGLAGSASNSLPEEIVTCGRYSWKNCSCAEIWPL